jgi:hypothetical protein
VTALRLCFETGSVVDLERGGMEFLRWKDLKMYMVERLVSTFGS